MKYNINLPTYVNVLINTLKILNLIINLKRIITSDYSQTYKEGLLGIINNDLSFMSHI